MKLLVPIKPVVDPDCYATLEVARQGRNVELDGLRRCTNPFDECALETALRLTEDGCVRGHRFGEIVAVSMGNSDGEFVLRAALALGATHAVRVDATDEALDARRVSHSLVALAEQYGTNLILLGKQTADGDGNEVAQRTAALLGWPQVIGATKIEQTEPDRLFAETVTDRGQLRVRVELPAVVSVDLQIVAADAVLSRHRTEACSYPPAVRFAALPAIIAAKRKPLDVRTLDSLIGNLSQVWQLQLYERVSTRSRCQFLESADDLVGHFPDPLESS